jgi:hypothetical protein
MKYKWLLPLSHKLSEELAACAEAAFGMIELSD